MTPLLFSKVVIFVIFGKFSCNISVCGGSLGSAVKPGPLATRLQCFL